MKIKNNRFVLMPVLCTDCQRYIFLESYRHGERYSLLAGRYLEVDICNECVEKYKFGSEKNAIDAERD